MDDYPTSELWIGGLREDLLQDDLREELHRYGTVHFCHMGHHPNRNKRMAYAKVTMGSVSEASRVLNALDGVALRHLSGGGALQVKFARVGAYGGSPPPSPLSPRGALHLRHTGSGSYSESARSASSTPTHAAAAAAIGRSAVPATSAAAAHNASAAANPNQQRCAHCGTPETDSLPLRRCSACKAVAFCSSACQLADWQARHAGECGMLQALARVLAVQPAVSATLAAAMEAPGSGLGRGVRTLLEARLVALEEQEKAAAAEAEPAAEATAAEGKPSLQAAAEAQPVAQAAVTVGETQPAAAAVAAEVQPEQPASAAGASEQHPAAAVAAAEAQPEQPAAVAGAVEEQQVEQQPHEQPKEEGEPSPAAEQQALPPATPGRQGKEAPQSVAEEPQRAAGAGPEQEEEGVQPVAEEAQAPTEAAEQNRAVALGAEAAAQPDQPLLEMESAAVPLAAAG